MSGCLENNQARKVKVCVHKKREKKFCITGEERCWFSCDIPRRITVSNIGPLVAKT